MGGERELAPDCGVGQCQHGVARVPGGAELPFSFETSSRGDCRRLEASLSECAVPLQLCWLRLFCLWFHALPELGWPSALEATERAAACKGGSCLLPDVTQIDSRQADGRLIVENVQSSGLNIISFCSFLPPGSSSANEAGDISIRPIRLFSPRAGHQGFPQARTSASP